MTNSLDEIIDQKLLRHYLELDGSGLFLNPPRTDEELDDFIRIALGISIPREVVTPGHRSPFEFVADLFFERVKNALGFANRSGGKTLSVAILNFLDMLFKPQCEIASAGAVKEQAEKCYRYFREFMERPWCANLNRRYEEVTGRPLFSPRDSIAARTIFGNAARLEVITGSEKGLRGPHPNKARIDEIDLMEWSVLQTGLSMAKGSDGIRGQNVFTSTRQYQHGPMGRLLEEASEKGIRVYEWDVWEILEKCGRRCVADREFGDCTVYPFCQGRAHGCNGFFLIDDFIDKVRVLDRRRFNTEWLNRLPSRHRVVFHMLEAKHVLTPERLQTMFGCSAPDPTWHRLSGIDFGSSPGHPFCYLKLYQLPGGRGWLLGYEYVAEQKLIRDHAAAIKRSPHFLASEVIYADWDAQDRLELRQHGINVQQAIKGPKSVNMGIDYLCELFSGYPPDEAPHLYIWHECSYTLKELARYSWPLRPDGSVDRTGNPEKRWDNCPDSLRMALYSQKNLGGVRYRGRNIAGI